MGTSLCAIILAGHTLCCLAEERNVRVYLRDVKGSRAPSGLSQAISSFLPNRSPVAEVEVIAWSGKAEFDARVPQLMDEVLVLVNHGEKLPQWTLLSLRRFRGTDRLEKWTQNMRWTENSCMGSVTWIEHWTEKPDAASFLAFVKKSNFGANELFDEIHPLVVYLFSYKSKDVVDEMAAGISSDERSRRRDLFMRMNASPADQ